MKKSKYILVVILAFFIGIIGTIFTLDYFDLLRKQEKIETTKTIKETAIVENDSISPSIEKVYDGVVAIQTYNSSNRITGTGTGFYYKKENNKAYIITNHHVIKGESKIKVTTNDDIEMEATVLGSDEYLDLAVLSTDATNVKKTLKFGDSSKVNVGDTVFAVGTPMGIKYKGTVTKGILSGKNRLVTVEINNNDFIMDVLQTDAAINPGNSGGPLLNLNGEVIGVTSLKLVEDEIEGMGFALPIENVTNSLDSLEKGEKIKRPLLGIHMADIANVSLLNRYDINLDDKVTYGAVIIIIENDSTASKAGFKVGDVILKINNDKITDTTHFRYALYKYRVGDTINITYLRDGKEHTMKVKLENGM